VYQKAVKSHKARVAQLTREIGEERRILADLDQQFRKEKHRRVAHNEYEIIEQHKRLTEAKKEDMARLVAIGAFYDERLSVVMEHLDNLKSRCGNLPARPCDVDLINKLTLDLRALQVRLRNLLNEQDHPPPTHVEPQPLVSPRFDPQIPVGVRSSH
jgi:hypothetical protein